MNHQLKNVPRGPCGMDVGDLAPWIVAYTAELATLRYTRLTVANYADSARHFAAWLRRADITLPSVDRTVIDRFARHTCRCNGRRRGARLSRRYVRRVQCFLAFLVDRGLMPPLTMPVADPVDAHVEEYQHWLTRHHGIRESTAKRHGA